jgi:TldD protein
MSGGTCRESLKISGDKRKVNSFDEIKNIDVERILKKALSGGGDFSEIFAEKKTGTVISSEAKRIEKFNLNIDFGIGLRVVKKDVSAYAFTNDINSLSELASTVAESIKSGGKGDVVSLVKRSAQEVTQAKILSSSVDPEKKIALVKSAEEYAWKHDRRVVQARVMYSDSNRQVFIANSNGFACEDNTGAVIFLVQCVVSDGRIMETGYEPMGGARGFEIFEEVSPEEIARRAVMRAIQTLTARSAPAGLMPVVLSSEAGGTMVHEAIGHGLEADFAGQGLSVYSGKLGEQVASTAITVIDDGTLPGRRGSIGCDDEGTLSERTVLVENGILKSYMTDLISAAKYDLRPTGNGRRESFRHRPVPRMTNTIIAPGKETPDDILRMAEKGLYVKKMGGGQVNPVTGDFVFEVSEGYMIEKGHTGEAIRGATLIGNGPKILLSIEHVGSDLGWGIGTCGKDGQGVPVGDAQPTLLIPEITVGGKIHEE